MRSSRPAAPAGSSFGGLYAVKPWFVAWLGGLARVVVARGVTADQLTWLGLACAAFTAVALLAGAHAPLLWLAVGPLCLARMSCNALDGAVARTCGPTRRGAVLNELADRGADLVTFAALAPVVGVGVAAAVAVTALATSLLAVVAQATTGQRLALGPMGKPDRMAVLSVGAAIAAGVGPISLTVAAWTIVGLGLVTVARRTAALWRIAGAAA